MLTCADLFAGMGGTARGLGILVRGEKNAIRRDRAGVRAEGQGAASTIPDEQGGPPTTTDSCCPLRRTAHRAGPVCRRERPLDEDAFGQGGLLKTFRSTIACRTSTGSLAMRSHIQNGKASSRRSSA